MQRILIIEDEDRVRKMLGRAMTQNGFDVFLAVNGQEGIIICRDNDIDWVITDIIMPEKEGIETIQELRRDFPDAKIIAISGGGYVGPTPYLTLAKDFGVVATFDKPLRIKSILDVINEGRAVPDNPEKSKPAAEPEDQNRKTDPDFPKGGSEHRATVLPWRQ